MKTYLSHGMGVNSVALMLWLLDNGIAAESVYCDHETDWPETREYLRMLQTRGYPITVLETRRDGLNLYDYYHKRRTMPLRLIRKCTQFYKVEPLFAYRARPCTVYLGISSDEAHRASRIKVGERPGEDIQFPLVDEGITRQGCLEIIKAHDLPVPRKSGCYICPFQRKSQWRELRTKHPELFCKAKALESATNERLVEQGHDRIYLAGLGKDLDYVANAKQMDLFGEREFERPCLCEL